MPRPRTEKSVSVRTNVAQRMALLSEICHEPLKFVGQTSLETSLASQGAFAQYENADLGIVRVCLNTLKRKANLEVGGGFEGLDTARLKALKALTSQDRDARPAIKGRAGRSQREIQRALRDECRGLQEELLLLTLAFKRSLSLWRIYAERLPNEVDRARCRKEYQELLMCFDHLVRPIDALERLGNVTKL